MTPEAQRIAIAEACGWRKRMHAKDDQIWQRSIGNSTLEMHEVHLPDYLNDLNAMHEAEKTLDAPSHRWADYGRELEAIIWTRREPPLTSEYLSGLVAHATAAQRAEAFLKAKGLWKDSALSQAQGKGK